MTENTVEHIGSPSFATVIYEFEPKYPSSQHFFVAQIVGEDDNGYLYQQNGATSSCDMTHDPHHAERLFDGFIKWDGCSHVTFGDDTGYLHLCGKRDFTQLREALDIVFNRCGELMKDRNVYLLESEFSPMVAV